MEELKSIVLNVLKNNYANFEGRARRKEYWMFALAIVIVYIVGVILAAVLGAVAEALSMVVLGIIGLAMLAIVAPAIALVVRRLHDIGKSGWYYFVGLIPLVGGIILLYFLVQEGTVGDNEYGPDPKAGERNAA